MSDTTPLPLEPVAPEKQLCRNGDGRIANAPGLLCRPCWNAAHKKKTEIPKDLALKLGQARTTEDWQKLAGSLAEVIQGVADGSVKATAAQTAMLKDIMSRAYGKPVATQQDKKVAAGIIILPALLSGEAMMLCPQCGYRAEAALEK